MLKWKHLNMNFVTSTELTTKSKLHQGNAKTVSQCKKLNSLRALVKVAIESPFGGTSIILKKIIINQKD
jgi:hypothetical protein